LNQVGSRLFPGQINTISVLFLIIGKKYKLDNIKYKHSIGAIVCWRFGKLSLIPRLIKLTNKILVISISKYSYIIYYILRMYDNNVVFCSVP